MDVSINQLSTWTGFDRRTVTSRVRGLPFKVAGKAHHFDSAAALRALYLTAGDSTRLDPAQERARLDQQRRLALEIDVARKRGELLPADEVREAWVNVAATTKARLLGLPSRLSPKLVGLGDARAIETTIRDAVITVLEELAGVE